MKWMRSFVPTRLFVLGIASTMAVGAAFAAQDQDDPKPVPPKSSAQDNDQPDQPKAPANSNQKNAQNNNQNNANQNNNANPNARQNSAANQNDPNADPSQPNANRPDRQSAEAQQRAAVLGVQFDAKDEQNISVGTVQQNGVLAQAGLRQNDRIVTADGRNFRNGRQLEAYLWAQSGRTVPIIIDRGGQRYTIQAAIPMHAQNSGWLGVFLDEGDANDQGARVTQVYPSGPAARAGLQVGDVIKQIDAQQIAGSADAVMLIRDLQPNAQSTFTVQRGTEELKLPVTVGTRGNFGYQSFYAGSQPGQQNQQFGNNQGFNQNDQFNGVPPHAMELESDRRNFEQHERIEAEIRALRDEIKQLRALLEKK